MGRRLLDLSVSDVHAPGAMNARRKVPMAQITSKKRNALPKSAFADPATRSYPIPDKAHADNAAARLEQQKGSMSPAKYARIKARIKAAQKRFGESAKPAKKGRALRIHAELAEGGSLHVRHMADASNGGPLRLDGQAITLADDEAKPVWIQLAKQGEFRGHPAGPFALTLGTFGEIIENFAKTANRAIPIDFEHASESEPTAGTVPETGAPAQGWIRDLKIQGGNLWGLVEWGDKARAYIREGAYRFISPAIRFGSRDRVTGAPAGARLTSAGLTNQPFLDGMAPLAAKDSAPTDGAQLVAAGDKNFAHHPGEYMPGIKAAMRLPELCTARECSEHLDRLRDHFDAAGGDASATHEGVRLADYLHPLRDAVGAKPGATWDEIFDIVDDLIDAAIGEHVVEDHGGESEETMTYADDDDGEDEGTTMADQNTALLLSEAQTKNAELSLQLKDATAKNASLETEIKTLRDEKKARDERDIDERVAEAFATYKDKKNLTDADKAAMRIVLCANRETFEKLYPRVRPEEQHLMRSLTETRTSEVAQVVDDKPVVKMGAIELTNKLMADEKLSYWDAQNKANLILRQQRAA